MQGGRVGDAARDPAFHAGGDGPAELGRRYTEYGFELEDICVRDALGRDEVEGDRLSAIRPSARDLSVRSGNVPPGARAEADQAAARAGVLGEPNGKPTVDEEVERILFEVIARSADTDAVDRPVTFQWKFKDAEPYYVRIDNGSTTTGKGLVEHADVTLKTSWADWVDVATRGHDARLAMRRKIRPRGSLRQLAGCRRSSRRDRQRAASRPPRFSRRPRRDPPLLASNSASVISASRRFAFLDHSKRILVRCWDPAAGHRRGIVSP